MTGPADPTHLPYIEMAMRNKATSELRTLFHIPLGVPHFQVPRYILMHLFVKVVCFSQRMGFESLKIHILPKFYMHPPFLIGGNTYTPRCNERHIKVQWSNGRSMTISVCQPLSCKHIYYSHWKYMYMQSHCRMITTCFTCCIH